MIVNDITITSIEAINAFNIVTGNYLFTLDELQDGSIAQSQETSDITGKGGRVLSTLKKNKSVTVSGTNGLISGGLLEMQTGGTFENKTTTVTWTDYLTVSSNAAATKYKAVGTTGAEITALYVKNSSGVITEELTQASAASSGKFAYDPDDKSLTFSGIADGTEIMVKYKRRITADVLEDDGAKFSGKCALYVDCFGEDKCSNVYRVQFYIPKADFSGEFTLDMGGDQTVHAFEAKALAGGGGCSGTSSHFTYTIFGTDTADVTG